MPCDSTIRLSLNVQAMNRPMLTKALERDGWAVLERNGVLYASKEGRAIEIRKDKAIVIKGSEDLLDKVYGAYSKELVRVGAAKFGAKLTPTNNINKWKVTLPQFSKSSF